LIIISKTLNLLTLYKQKCESTYTSTNLRGFTRLNVPSLLKNKQTHDFLLSFWMERKYLFEKIVKNRRKGKKLWGKNMKNVLRSLPPLLVSTFS